MSRTRVKICGLRRPEDIDYVNEAMPDFAGFIFVPGRRRFVDPEQAAGLRAGLADGIRAVGVFADAAPAYVKQTAETAGLDVIQLHGNEDEEYIRHVRNETGLPVIKAVKVETEADVARAVSSPADRILLDNGRGGTGASFDWSLVADVPRDFILAGGLSPGNVANAIEAVHPWGVDVSSGVETDGYKDPEKIRRFMNTIRH